MSKNTGGCAFPNDGKWGNGIEEPGMTLRDWFAGQAISTASKGYRAPEDIAAYAYEIADAMLAERSKP
jgi:hypothetical protein